jgi:prepilin-type N-terminal cleavage/methylation domain-containing protein
MKSHKGITLLELIVAISLSAVVLAAIFFAWRFIERHTVVQSRKAVFYSEADRISRSVTEEIRKCKLVTAFSGHSITFIKNPSGDTIRYDFESLQLTRNGIALESRAPTAHVNDFAVIKNQESYQDKTADLLLDIRIGVVDNFGDSSTALANCAVSCNAMEY